MPQQYVYVQKRPFLNEFLELLSRDFNIVIYTSSEKEYADAILDNLDKYKIINKRYYRADCELQGEEYIKD